MTNSITDVIMQWSLQTTQSNNPLYDDIIPFTFIFWIMYLFFPCVVSCFFFQFLSHSNVFYPTGRGCKRLPSAVTSRYLIPTKGSLSLLSLVSMVTVSSDWGQGSNWPIVSKLHFSEWFPLSCYWNRALAVWWIHLVIHSLEGRREQYKHDTGGRRAQTKRGQDE